MKEKFVQMICHRLKEVESQAASEFENNKNKFGIGYCSIDDLLPLEYANQIYKKFEPENKFWREMASFREKKLTSKQYDKFDPTLKEITFAIQDPRVISSVEKITGISNQKADEFLYAGGLSMMREGDFLDPHIDNSHDQEQKLYRRLNLLYYVSPDWTLEAGGNLELWDQKVSAPVTIVSKFNRLVLMETHSLSWHSVSKVVKKNAFRCCVSNYYFSEISPKGAGVDYYHVTSFMASPQKPIKRMLCHFDNAARSIFRKIYKPGFSKRDVYKANK